MKALDPDTRFPAGSRRRVAVAVVGLLCIATPGAACGGSARTPSAGPSVAQTPAASPRTRATVTPTPLATVAPTVRVVAPRDGASTTARTTVVRGRASTDADGEATLTVAVNRRRFDVSVSGARHAAFSIPVALEPGANRITITVQPDPDSVKVTSQPVVLTRKPGPSDGKLDHATALWVAEAHDSVYWLCGEGDDCYARGSCQRVSWTRVDCPFKSQFDDDDPIRCGVVISVQLRGRDVHSYAYPCSGPWRTPSAFVHPWVARTGRRYRVDERQCPWLSDEINEPNRYGVPRFDVKHDEFIP